MGMKKLSSRRGNNGDLRVEFKVQMPKYLSVNQRTIVEMLADEMGDPTAKRIMNLNQFKDRPPPSKTDGTKPTSSNSSDDHKNEGFLKNMWHSMTGQHDNSEGQQKGSSGKTEGQQSEQDEEPKKASGSG
jgi:molecular chaperone DnaJ